MVELLLNTSGCVALQRIKRFSQKSRLIYFKAIFILFEKFIFLVAKLSRNRRLALCDKKQRCVMSAFWRVPRFVN